MIEQELLAHLRERANPRGVVPVCGEVLAGEVGASLSEVGATLARLERAGLLKILAPLPFLVLKLSSWSSKGSKATDSGPTAYSYSKLSSNRLSESYRPNADQVLMSEILSTLGETDPATFEGAIKNYSPEVIRKALDRVRRTRSLRKNPTALFRYLLTKIS